MSLNDRDYMRSDSRTPRGFGSFDAFGIRKMSPVTFLIFLNIAVFFAEAFAERAFGHDVFFSWFGLSLDALAKGRVWTLLTYSFLHANILHIFCNMLGLYFIGKFVERALGTRKFVAVYILGALAGAAAWLALSFFKPSHEVLVGASASVMSVFAAFCMLYPPMPITFLLFFVIPISMRPMTMLKAATAFEVLGLLWSMTGGQDVVAYSAHLGGLACGVLFASAAIRGKLNFMDSFSFPKRKPSAAPRQKGGRASDYVFKVDIRNPEELSRQVDAVLDKINRTGFASLTDDEREILRRARENLK